MQTLLLLGIGGLCFPLPRINSLLLRTIVTVGVGVGVVGVGVAGVEVAGAEAGVVEVGKLGVGAVEGVGADVSGDGG